MVGSTSRYREACARFSLVIVLSVEKPAVTFGLLLKFSRTKSIFAIQEHCAGIGRPILPSEGSVIAAARVCFGGDSGKKNSCQLVLGVLMCRPDWLPRPTFLLATLLIIIKYCRVKHNGCGRPKIWM